MSELHDLQERLRVVTDRVRKSMMIDEDMEDYEDALSEQDALYDMIREMQEEDEDGDQDGDG